MAKFLNWLMPKEARFFRMLEKQSAIGVEGAKVFKELIDNYAQLSETRRQHLVTRIKEIEGFGDKITHDIVAEVNKSFITPFDREDIYNITIILDDILDLLNAAAIRLILFRIKEIPKEMRLLSDEGFKAITISNEVVKQMEKLDGLHRLFIDIHSSENKADEIYHDALAKILNDKNEKKCADIIKYKEIYDILEKILDKCENFTNIIEGIVVKHG